MAVLFVLAMAATLRSHAAFNIYLQLTTSSGVLVGDSTDPTYSGAKGWFQVQSFSFGATQTVNLGSANGGAGAGKVSFSGVSIQKNVNLVSPKLFQDLAAGVTFQYATLVAVKAGSTATGQPEVPVFQITFGLVALDSQTWSGEEELTETLDFQAGAALATFTVTNPDGTMGKPVSGGWDRVRNVPWSGQGQP
jgi:type VI secretion system secreted protein Hcp